jgi:hypothetical protein
VNTLTRIIRGTAFLAGLALSGILVLVSLLAIAAILKFVFNL